MPGALKVQTAPGVWTTVGGQGAPGADSDLTQATADLRYVMKVGDVMTGPLSAPRVMVDEPPTALNHLTRKDYVDTFVPLAGALMTGQLIISEGGGNTPLVLRRATSENPGLAFQHTDGTSHGYIVASSTFMDFQTPTAPMRFITGAGSPKMTINGAGLVSVPGAFGVTVPSAYWSPNSTSVFFGAVGGVGSLGSNRVSIFSNGYRTTTGWSAPGVAGTTGSSAIGFDPSNGHILFRSQATTPTTTSGPAVVASISPGGTGTFLMGKTTASQTTKGIEFRMPGHLILNTGDTQMDTNIICDKLAGTAVNASPYARWLAANVIKGSITYTGTAIAYNTTSHAPWKGNVVPLDGASALAVIEQLRPVSYQWKLDADGMPTEQGTPAGEVAHGFVAQELFEVVPGAVTPGSGDEAEHDAWLVRRKAQEDALAADPQAVFDEDIDPVVPWQIDPSKLIPDLVAGIQALAVQLGAVQSFNADLIAALQAVLNPADPATFSSLSDLIPEA